VESVYCAVRAASLYKNEHSSSVTALTAINVFTSREISLIGGKDVPLHAMKAYRGRRGTTPVILNLRTTWM
jgi:hypothetical protein